MSRQTAGSTAVAPPDQFVDTGVPYIVSVDDHLVEPASLWESRLPTKLRARGPWAIETPNEGVVWELDGQRFPLSGSSAVVGIPPESRTRIFNWDTVRPGCFDPIERVKDMDADGVLASLCFPSLPGFGGTKFNAIEDRELAFACIQAYNDFQVEEWAAATPGRLFPMVLLPYWDISLAVHELQRSADRGAVAVAFSENPNRQGFPSLHDRGRYWDPLFAAAQEAAMPFCLHFGSSSWVFSPADDAPHIVPMVASPLNSAFYFIDWIFSGVFERFPGFQVVFSESYLGWIPFVLEHADQDWKTHYNFGFDRTWLPRTPSEYFHDNISVCLVYDTFGAEMIERIGVDRILAESDYPHADSQWPNTRAVLEKSLGHLTPTDRMKVLRTNAEKLFHLELAEPAVDAMSEVRGKIVRVYADESGETHLEDLDLGTKEMLVGGTPSRVITDIPATTVLLTQRLERRRKLDLHPAPRRQFVVVLSGEFEIVTTDGDSRRFGRGDCLLAEDLDGKGHTHEDVGEDRLRTIAIGISEDWVWPWT